MSGGPKRNPDKMNTIGVVVVGVCGAVLVYVTITALQAFYMDDTSDVQTMADYGGNDETAAVLRSTQMDYINTYAPNSIAPGQDPTYRIAIDQSIKRVGELVKQPSSGAYLVPGMAPSITSTIEASFGRPKKLAAPAAGSGSAATGSGSAETGSGSAAPAETGSAGSAAPATGSGSGSAAPAAGSAAAPTPTGANPGSANVPGAPPAKKDEPKAGSGAKKDEPKGSAAPAKAGSAAKGNGR